MDDVTPEPFVDPVVDQVDVPVVEAQAELPPPFGTPHTLVDKVKAELGSMAQYLGVEYDHVKEIFVKHL